MRLVRMDNMGVMINEARPALLEHLARLFSQVYPGDMKLEQLPDDFTPLQFMQLDKESLDRVDFTRKRWLCQCKGCTNGTTVRDYGLGDYYLLDRNSKGIEKNPAKYWMGPNHYWLCSKHKHMSEELDWEKIVLVELDERKLGIVKPIEKSAKLDSERDAGGTED